MFPVCDPGLADGHAAGPPVGFGRLSADREIVAIFAAGIAFPRAARRILLVMGALVSIIAYAWNDTVVPAASTAFWDLKVETFKHIGKEDKPLFRSIDSKDNKGVKSWSLSTEATMPNPISSGASIS